MSLLSEVATPLDGFILTAKLKWIGGGGTLQNIQIHIFYPFRLIKWSGKSYLIIYTASDVRLQSENAMGQAVK